jgi:hypothetical protein
MTHRVLAAWNAAPLLKGDQGIHHQRAMAMRNTPFDDLLTVARRVRATPKDDLELRTRITPHQLERLLGLGIKEYAEGILGEAGVQNGWCRHIVWAHSAPSMADEPITAEEAHRLAQMAMIGIQVRILELSRAPVRQAALSRAVFGSRDCDLKGGQTGRMTHAYVEALAIFGLVSIQKGACKLITSRAPESESEDPEVLVVPFDPAWREDVKVRWTVEEKVRAAFEAKFLTVFPRVRPAFLAQWPDAPRRRRLELDGYSAALSLAFEYQGAQHFRYTPFFHRNGPIDLAAQQKRDDLKIELCAAADVRLVVVPTHVNTEARIKLFVEALRV